MASSAPPQHYLTLCAIVKDEDEYIEEWVAFHLAVGVEHFLIIDNGHSKVLPSLLAGYIEDGIVELRRFHSAAKQQREAYDRALRWLEGKSRWVGFLDIDEFAFPSAGSDLREVLKGFEKFAGVAVNWVSFGSAGHIAKPAGWVIENYTQRGELEHGIPLPQTRLPDGSYRPVNSHVKCFVNPARTLFFRTAHHFRFKPGQFAVTENGERIDSPLSPSVSVSTLRINHYWSKSLDELRAKIAKGRISQATTRKTSGYAWAAALERERASGGVDDREILRFLEPAKTIAARNRARIDGNLKTKVSRLRYRPGGWVRSLLRKLGSWVRQARRSMAGSVGR